MFEVKIIFLIFLWQVLLCSVSGDHGLNFHLIGSKFFRKGVDYKVIGSANSRDPSFAMEGKAGIIRVKYYGYEERTGKYFEQYKNMTINYNQMTSQTFQTSQLPPGRYELSYEVLESFQENYSRTTQVALSVMRKEFSAFIQTDKAIYKGDDVVRFRVFTVDFNSFPFSSNGSKMVVISGPNNIKVKNFLNVTYTKGKYENEFKLASFPVEGTWTIEATIGSVLAYKNFEVRQYELPLFDASISAPSNFAMSDKILPVSVDIKYSFGKPAEGTAVVTFALYGYMKVFTKFLTINKTVENFDVDITKDFNMSPSYLLYETFVEIEVEFTDKITGQLATAKTRTTLKKSKFEIIVNSETSYIVGLVYVYKFSVRKIDGTPAPANSLIKVETTHSDGTNKTTTHPLDEFGSIEIEEIFNSTYYYVRVLATYEDAQAEYYLYGSSDLDKNFVAIDILTPRPQLYSPVDVDIHCAQQVQSVFVVLISKGVIVHNERVRMRRNKGSFFFIPTFAFGPSTDIVVYFTNQKNQISSFTKNIQFRDRLASVLNLSLNSTTCKPGENITLSVNTAIDSTVSLLAVDQRVLTLKSGNDISLGEVYDDLAQYNYNSDPSDFFGDYQWGRPWNWWYQENYAIKFARNNLLFLTNAPEEYQRPSYFDYWRTQDSFPMFEEGQPPIAMSSMASSSSQPSRVPGAGDNFNPPAAPPPEPKLREDFSETFLWETVDVTQRSGGMRSNRGIKRISVQVPDSITSYIVSGVSMNDRFGMGLPLTKPKLTVFQAFFIQLSLPFSVKRSEKLRLDLSLFNFLSSSQNVTLSVNRNDAEFVLADYQLHGWKRDDQTYYQSILSKSDSTLPISAVLQAKKLGSISLRIKAVGPLAGDAIQDKLRVVPEGVQKFMTSSALISKLKNDKAVNTQLSCILPPTAVNDTVSISASVIGDIMGGSLNNLERLIQMPNGCGEQNMLNFVPNIVVLKYLEASNKLTPTIREKIISYTEQGYQRELEYLRYDGSFSAFGNSDTNGSTWLTAFVVKSFILARPYITVDINVIQRSLYFLLTKQSADGSFREDGIVFHADMQGDASSGVSLTAYITAVFYDCLEFFPQFQNNFDTALNYLINHQQTASEVYPLAILTYALSKSNHPNFNAVYSIFSSYANETASELHWEKSVAGPSYYWNPQPRSLDIEVTAYGLLAIYKKDISIALKILNWLVKQQNSLGGYQSTQDTVVALEALASVASAFASGDANLNLTLTPEGSSPLNAIVNQQNQLTLQTFNLNQNVRKLNVATDAASSGVAVVSLSCSYYEFSEAERPRFNIYHIFEDPCIGYLKSRICIQYIPDLNETSNMVLVRINLPSGFVYQEFGVADKAIGKIETSKGGSEVILYINNLSSKRFCFYINAMQYFYVEEIKKGSIEVTDYYDTTKKGSLLFSVPKLEQCKPKDTIGNGSVEPSEDIRE